MYNALHYYFATTIHIQLFFSIIYVSEKGEHHVCLAGEGGMEACVELRVGAGGADCTVSMAPCAVIRIVTLGVQFNAYHVVRVQIPKLGKAH